MNDYRKFAVVLALLFAAFVVVEYYRPKPMDWNQTLSNKDKIPYGTYVIYQLMPGLFKGQEVRQVRQPIYNQLEENYLEFDEGAYAYDTANFVFINRTFSADSADINSLLEFVHEGNDAFISAHYFAEYLRDTLRFSVDQTEKGKQDSLRLLFTHPSLKSLPAFAYEWEKVNTVLEADSGANHVVLGKNSAGGVNFVRVPLGEGNVYLSTVPLAFSNYYVLDQKRSAYASAAFSHLPVRPVWWDEYQKQGPLGEDSIFRVLLANDALAWAYYITLGGLLLFVLFESKRTQRIIPVLEKPRNTTLDFVRVVGSLYFNYRDHQTIALKKINYFLEYLRLHYFESTTNLDHDFQERISRKSGLSTKDITDLFNLIQYIRNTDDIEEHSLWSLNQKLEHFYRQAGR